MHDLLHFPVVTPPTFEEIVDQWNLIPGVEPVRFADVQIGRGIHKAVEAAIKEHPTIEWWMELFEAVHESDELCGRTGDLPASLGRVLHLQGPSHFIRS